MAGLGQSWGCEEVRSLIEIWSNDHIKSQLSKAHKNSAVFSLFSKQLRVRGCNRSVEQCRVKAKKLREQYIHVHQHTQSSLHNSSVLSAAFDSCLCSLPGAPLEEARSFWPIEKQFRECVQRHKWRGCCHVTAFWFVSAGSDQSKQCGVKRNQNG